MVIFVMVNDNNLKSILSGTVVHGNRIGRQLGFPTANIYPESGADLPDGVYAVSVMLDGVRFPGIANLGHRPSVDVTLRRILEVHLFDFDGDLYGRRLEVEPVAYLRAERKFATLEALQEQVARDMRQARTMTANL